MANKFTKDEVTDRLLRKLKGFREELAKAEDKFKESHRPYYSVKCREIELEIDFILSILRYMNPNAPMGKVG